MTIQRSVFTFLLLFFSNFLLGQTSLGQTSLGQTSLGQTPLGQTSLKEIDLVNGDYKVGFKHYFTADIQGLIKDYMIGTIRLFLVQFL